MYLLDTGVVCELRKPKPHGAVWAGLHATAEAALFLSAVTLGEVQAGIELIRDQNPAKADEIEAWSQIARPVQARQGLNAVASRGADQSAAKQ